MNPEITDTNIEKGQCVMEYDDWHINHDEETDKYYYYDECGEREVQLVHEEYVSAVDERTLDEMYGGGFDVCGEFDNDFRPGDNNVISFRSGWFKYVG